METKDIAIAANLSALKSVLTSTLERVTDAENDSCQGQMNQAIGAACGIDALLAEASALLAAAYVLHRRFRV